MRCDLGKGGGLSAGRSRTAMKWIVSASAWPSTPSPPAAPQGTQITPSRELGMLSGTIFCSRSMTRVLTPSPILRVVSSSALA